MMQKSLQSENGRQVLAIIPQNVMVL